MFIMSTATPEFLTADEVAERLRVDANTVRRWARAGLIPVVYLPRAGIRFDYPAVCAQLRVVGVKAKNKEVRDGK
jgi:excisionase family DNA binding protein